MKQQHKTDSNKTSKSKGNADDNENSILGEVFAALIDLLLGNVYSKIGFGLLSLFVGVVVIFRPIIDNKGTHLKKGYLSYSIGFLLFCLSIILFVFWYKKRERQKKGLNK